MCRDSFLYGRMYDRNLLFGVVSAVIALVLGVALFYKYQDNFIFKFKISGENLSETVIKINDVGMELI